MVWLPAEPWKRPPRGSIPPAAPGVHAPPPGKPDIIPLGVPAAPAFGRKGLPQPLDQILTIIAPHHFVANAQRELIDPRFQRGAALRRRKAAAGGLPRRDQIREPARGADDFLDRDATAGAGE